MPAQLAIVHGWSDSSRSFLNLKAFLAANGRQAAEIWLGDYISTDDDVRVEDVGRRMQEVLQAAVARGDLKAPFDLIVHSTGGLVVREWIARYFPDGAGCPAKRIVMLAPANFGSRLASLGKSMIGRLAKGWNNWFQTGTEMLAGLELASRYQWDLARRDLFDPAGSGGGPYGAGRIWPFVITGSRGFPGGLRQIVNEDGADGTVRAAAANLNAVGLTVDFTGGGEQPEITPWHWRAGDLRFPFAVLPDRDHSTIHEPQAATGAIPQFSDRLGALILEALDCRSDLEYRSLQTAWASLCEQTAALAGNDAARAQVLGAATPSASALHQYMQAVTYVRDDDGQPVDDYFLEFFAPAQAGNADAVYFHREVIAQVHVNTRAPSRRCLFIDRTDLMNGFYPLIADPARREVAVSLSAARIGDNIRYFDSTRVGARGSFVVHREEHEARVDLPARLFRNCTHLVEIVIPRRAVERVFRLSR